MSHWLLAGLRNPWAPKEEEASPATEAAYPDVTVDAPGADEDPFSPHAHFDTTRQSVSESLNGEPPAQGRSRLRKYAVPVVILIVLVVLVALAASNPGATLRAAVALLDGLRSLGIGAPFAIIGILIVLVTCALPSWFVWVGAGTIFTLVWGQALGLAIALISVGGGVWIGSICAFFLGRSVFRPLISEWTARRPVFRAIDLAVTQRGLQVGMLIKLSPVFPLNVMNYMLAITNISWFNFVVTCSGSLLSVIVYVLIGASLSSLANIGSVGQDGDSRRTMVRRARSRLLGPPSARAWPLSARGSRWKVAVALLTLPSPPTPLPPLPSARPRAHTTDPPLHSPSLPSRPADHRDHRRLRARRALPHLRDARLPQSVCRDSAARGSCQRPSRGGRGGGAGGRRGGGRARLRRRRSLPHRRARDLAAQHGRRL
jgi:uncharacterized membrane protein YdjX (TVP38/TMEM64 family)